MTDKTIKAALRSGKNRQKLKKIVMILAVFLMLGFGFWFYISHQEQHATPSSAGLNKKDIEERRVYNPKYMSRDKQDRPYTVTAEIATEDQNGLVHLKQAKMVLEHGPNKFIVLKADTARFQNQLLRKADLEKNVQLTVDNDMTADTSNAAIDFQEGSIDGPNEISGEGTRGAVKAKRFKVKDHFNVLELYDHPEVTINE